MKSFNSSSSSTSTSSSNSPNSIWSYAIPDLMATPGLTGSFQFDEPRLKVEQMTDSSATDDSDNSSSPTHGATKSFQSMTLGHSSGDDSDRGWNPWTGRDFDLHNVLRNFRQQQQNGFPDSNRRSTATTNSHWSSSQFTHGQQSRQMAGQPKLERELHAEDYITYPDNQKHSSHEIVRFYIEGGPKDDVILPDPDSFVINVWKPSAGGQCDVQISFDRISHRHVCSFLAEYPGVYTCNVFLGLQGIQQVRGSPLEINVARIYTDPWMEHILITRLNTGKTGYGEVLATTGGAWGIDVDRFTEKIYVADRPAHKIRVFCKAGQLLAEFGRRGAGEGQFYRPTSIAIDEVNMRILVTDKGNHRVSCFALQGYHYMKSFGTLGDSDGELCCPWGVAVSPNGKFIAVGDNRNNRIQLFDKHGRFLVKIGLSDGEIGDSPTFSEFRHPRGICFDRTGSYIYVSDIDAGNVFKINIQMTEKVRLLAPGVLKCPQGLCLDFSGNIVIADSGHNCIRVVSPDGSRVITLQDTPQRPLDRPLDVAMMRHSQIVFVNSKGCVRMC